MPKPDVLETIAGEPITGLLEFFIRRAEMPADERVGKLLSEFAKDVKKHRQTCGK